MYSGIMSGTKIEWQKKLRDLGFLWVHDGNPKRPHVRLTSGLHSNGFVDIASFFFVYPDLGRKLCDDFVNGIFRGIEGLPKIDCVISPAFGAITIGNNIAASIDTGFCFAVPEMQGNKKIFSLEKRFNVEGSVLLPVEDVITTAGSIGATITAAEAKGAIIAPIILAVCNRSGLATISGRRIVSMLDIPMPSWEEAECPLCKVGSKAIPAKVAGNWKLLTEEPSGVDVRA